MKRGSAAWVVRAARDWAATVGRGLGLVSYLSLGERDRAISAFKAECAKGGLTTATLSARAESGRAFLEAIRGATANVLLVLDPEVLIYGNEPDRSPAWLNFHRESIIEFPGPQIWWMPEQAATLLGRDLPDLGRFFLFREELTEIDTTTAVPEKRTLDAPLSGAENGGEVLLARALRAAESGADPARIWLELGVPAIRALLDSSQRNQALSAMDSLTARIGPPEVIRSWAEANSDPAARLKGDQDAPGRERLAQALLQAGRLFQDLYRQEEARSFMLEALPIFREVGDRLGEANCIMSLGDIALRRSDHEQARLRFLEALPIYREVGDRLGEANCIKSLGNIALDRSDHEQARLRFLEALPIYREFGDRLGEANCIMSLGDIALQRSDHEQARLRFLEALPIFREVGSRLGEANCIRSLGQVDAAEGLVDPAREQYAEALAIFRALPEPYSAGLCLYHFARLDAPGSEARRQHLAEAIEAWNSIDRPDLVARLRARFPGEC